MAVPAPAVGDVVEVKVYCEDLEQTSVTTTHWRVDAVNGFGVDMQTLANDFNTAFGAEVPPGMANDVTMSGTGVRILAPVLSIEIESNNASFPGSGLGVSLPRQTSGLLSVYADIPGPKGRGRMYIPFPAATFNTTSGIPTAAWVTHLDSIGTLVTTPFVSGGGVDNIHLRPVLWHRSTRTSDDLSRFVSRQKWATQKRRGSYGKPNSPP